MFFGALISVLTFVAQPTTVAISNDEIPAAALGTMYARELGDRYNPNDLPKLLSAHRLLEKFFADGEARKALLPQIVATGIDPNILGRLCRIRMHWPVLAPGVYYINERVGPHPVHYFLGVPRNYDRAAPSPLVIMLPTADAFVAEPKPNADQVTAIYTGWMTQELQRHPDALLIMPLLNLDQLYGPSYSGMNTVMQPMVHAANRVNIDPQRVYMVGHAMSAHAVWNLALHYPTYFAAIDSFAGGASADWQRVRLMNLRNVLSVVWHDVDDSLTKVDTTRKLVQVLKKMGCEVDYEETKGLGHTPSAEVVQRLYAKMRARTRTLYPEHVSVQSNRPDTIFNRVDWVQIYQPLKPGDEQKLMFKWGIGHMITYTNSFKLDAAIGKNRIDATSDNVASLRFHLNDQMVDFAKPINVYVNKRGVFEGFVKPDVAEMLHDQLFLGRGWRYFTGVVDIDFGPKPATRPTTKPASRGS